MKTKLITVLILIVAITLTFGQNVKLDNARLSPRLLNYQGYLTDTLGNPITNPSLSLSFAIFDNPSGGSQKWSETQSAVSIDKGIFNVLLGSVMPIPDSVLLNSTSRYLQLTVAGQVLSPRTRIVSSAYAYTSTYSDTALYAKNAAADNDWRFIFSDVADTTLQTNGKWGLARASNTLLGTADSTHVNLGIMSTTGYTGQNYKYCTVGGGFVNTAGNMSASVAGGYVNNASGAYSAIGGGQYNNASGNSAVVAGGYANTAGGAYAGVASGINNAAVNDYGAVTGGNGDSTKAVFGFTGSGYSNLAGDASADTGAVVCGGWNNSVTERYSVVCGGMNNSAMGWHTFVGGGDRCTASGQNSVVVGGLADTASGYIATVVGGRWNKAYSFGGFVGGGESNIVSGSDANVGGGAVNSATNFCATIGGGRENVASFEYTTVAGGRADTAKAIWAGVGSGYSNLAGDATDDTAAAVAGGQDNSAIAKCAFVGGGYSNNADSAFSSVAGGYSNAADGRYSAIGGGWDNSTSGNFSVVCGGFYNTADGGSVVSGGRDNQSYGGFSAVCGGYNNTSYATSSVTGGHHNNASGAYSAIGGGAYNVASQYYSAVPGGYGNTSAGEYGFAVGGNSTVPIEYINSAAFNGQTATAAGQTRVGVLSKTGGSFTIDHPSDPENRILNHYFVESPEMVLIYRGSAKISSSGKAVVHLPDYFDALNKNPQIVVSGVGTYEVFVESGEKDNQFTIGGKPNATVNWIVTAERKDPSAEIIKIIMPVEQPKTGGLAGRSLDDEFLVTTMAQLERMGKASGFKFRHVSEEKRYKEMKRTLEENGK